MAPASHILILSLLVTLLLTGSMACSSHKNFDKKYSFCTDLPVLDSTIHWSYNPNEAVLSIAFSARQPSPKGWVSWAINPYKTGMGGSQALLAFVNSDGKMNVKTYNITGYGPVTESGVWYRVEDSYAKYSDGYMTIFATVVLPEKGLTTVNHVWQVGPLVTDGKPNVHEFKPENLKAKGKLDLMKGQIVYQKSNFDSLTRKKNIHGILNVVSWGIMFPIGVIMARYVKKFPGCDPVWFYLHVSCQIVAYILGVAGWGTGMKLGSKSKGVTYLTHRNLGITLFTFATLQMFALFVRPKKDNKYRICWDIYHRCIGYSIIVMGIINVFKGFEILKPGYHWRTSYIAVISSIGGIAILLEICTRILYFRNKNKTSDGSSNC